VLLAWLMYIKNIRLAIPPLIIKPVKKMLDANYGFDYFYEQWLAAGLRKLGHFLWKYIDTNIIDSFFVNGTAKLVKVASVLLKSIQSGYIYHYAFTMIIGLFLLITFFVKI